MIGQLKGTISYKNDKFLIVDVQGVGYKVSATADTLSQILLDAAPITLWTHLVVREDALDLYGFLNQQELDFFELLITVSGIGPKSALGILSLATPETLRRAIIAGQTEYLTKVSGIGKKSAEKIVIELRDKLSSIGELVSAPELHQEAEVLEALEALGYSSKEAREAIKKIGSEVTDTSAKIKLALKGLGK